MPGRLFLGYASCLGQALIDRRLYLPGAWSDDDARRSRVQIPESVTLAATEASVAAVDPIEQTIGEINTIVGSIAAAVEEQGAATAEISRNVAETASAANEMAGRNAEVSREAEQTGKHAAEVRDAELNCAMVGLRHSVIRAVRTSTTEVDRGKTARHKVDLDCRVSVTGRRGAHRTGHRRLRRRASVEANRSLAQGTRGMLHVDNVDLALPFTVVAGGDDSFVWNPGDGSDTVEGQARFDTLERSHLGWDRIRGCGHGHDM